MNALARPSQRLSAGAVSGAAEAIACFVEQYQLELGALGSDDPHANVAASEFEEAVRQGRQCLAELRALDGINLGSARQATRRSLFEAWSRSQHEHVAEIGWACLSGEFSALAI